MTSRSSFPSLATFSTSRPSGFFALHFFFNSFLLQLLYSFFLYSETERSKLAYVTFKDLQGAETAVLLSVCFSALYHFPLYVFKRTECLFFLQGATIVDSSVIVTMAPDYQLSPEALASLVTTSLFLFTIFTSNLLTVSSLRSPRKAASLPVQVTPC